MAAEISEDGGMSVLRRLRSTALLLFLIVALGAIVAASIGVLLVTSISLLNHALG